MNDVSRNKLRITALDRKNAQAKAAQAAELEKEERQLVGDADRLEAAHKELVRPCCSCGANGLPSFPIPGSLYIKIACHCRHLRLPPYTADFTV